MGVAAVLVMWPRPTNKLSFSHPTEVPYEIWLRLAKRFWRKRSLKMVDGRTPDVGACLYYKLTNESKGSGELKKKNVTCGLCLGCIMRMSHTWLLSWRHCHICDVTMMSICYLSPVKRICVFEHSVMTNFNCACQAIQRGQGSGFLSEGSSWLTACMSEQWRFWRDCADAQARLNLRCSHRR